MFSFFITPFDLYPNYFQHFQLLAGADSTWLLALDLNNDASKYAYLSMGNEACKCTPEDKKMYKEVQRAMGVRRWY